MLNWCIVLKGVVFSHNSAEMARALVSVNNNWCYGAGPLGLLGLFEGNSYLLVIAGIVVAGLQVKPPDVSCSYELLLQMACESTMFIHVV